jgi:hypothetical protein
VAVAETSAVAAVAEGEAATFAVAVAEDVAATFAVAVVGDGKIRWMSLLDFLRMSLPCFLPFGSYRQGLTRFSPLERQYRDQLGQWLEGERLPGLLSQLLPESSSHLARQQRQQR